VRPDCGFGRGGTVDAPAAGNPFEFPLSAVFEEEPGAGDKILDRLGDEHLARAGAGGDSGADRDGQACDLPVVKFALAGVDARAKLKAEITNRSAWKKLAFVSDVDWVSKATRLFTWAMPGELKVFEMDELDQARSWVAE